MLLSLLARLNSCRLWRFRFRVAGHYFYPPTLDRMVALALFRTGLMGREQFHLFRSLLRPGMTVVDIGANQGVFTLFCADRVGPAGSVIAFEPDAQMFSALRHNTKANALHWVELHNVALGSEDGQLTLHASRLNRGDNRLVPPTRPGAKHQTAVRVVTLDRILAGRKADLIKLDVQGWEGAVLKGMKELLASAQPPWIHLEICPHLLREAGSSFDEVHGLLKHHGYSLREADVRQTALDVNSIPRLEGALRYKNVLAVPSARAQPSPSSSPG
jgi:FkbM family methyltransferase